MADIEKVIKGLEHCTSYGSTCDQCDYWEHNRNEDDPHCGDVLMRDALELLKERQPKKGKWKTVRYLSYLRDFKRCTCCGYICQGWDSETGVIYDYCPDCGAEMENGNTNRECVENPIITVLKERYKEDGEQE